MTPVKSLAAPVLAPGRRAGNTRDATGPRVMDDLYSTDFRTDPYWWEAAPPSAEGSVEPPTGIDAVVVGSGYAGLAAALAAARAGTAVAVLEEAPVFGHGASTRNGGHVSGGVNLGKASSGSRPSPLVRRLGPEGYARLLDEASRSLACLESLVQREDIRCHYERRGRFVGAVTGADYRALEAKIPLLDRDGDAGVRMLSRERQREEIASDLYAGGMVVERAGKLHPALYHRGLVDACRRAGVVLCAGAGVRGIEREGAAFRVRTGSGSTRAERVLVATNAYTGPATPWLRRRIVPVASCMIATEPLGADRAGALIPRGRTLSDTLRVLHYYRLSPDGTRVLFGGRESFTTVDPGQSARLLHRAMLRVFPQLEGVRVTHSWYGYVGFSFDRAPHLVHREGVDYVAGCNGSGVAMMTFLGDLAGRRIAGEDSPSAFDAAPFPTRPGYTGSTWFLPLVGRAYRTLDWLDGRGIRLG